MAVWSSYRIGSLLFERVRCASAYMQWVCLARVAWVMSSWFPMIPACFNAVLNGSIAVIVRWNGKADL